MSIASTRISTFSHFLTFIVTVPSFIAPLPYTTSFHSPQLGVIRTFCIIRSPVNRIVAVVSLLRSISIVTDHAHSGRVSQGLSEYSSEPTPSIAPVPVCHFLSAA